MRGDGQLESSSDSAPSGLHGRVLDTTIDGFGAGALVTAVILSVQTARAPDAQITEWIGIASLATFPALRFVRSRLGDVRTAQLVLAHSLVVCAYYQCFRGPTPGTALVQAGAILLAGVFFGARGIAAACAATAASLVFAATLLISQVVEPWRVELWDPMSALVWLRYGAIVGLVGGGLAIVVGLMLKSLERTNEELQRTLERERAERATREAAQRALHNAQRFQALSQLAAGLAHDFNNSLTVIMNGAQCLRETELDAEASVLVDEIAHATSIAAATAKQLLALSRTNVGRPDRVEVGAQIRRASRILQHALGERVTITLEDECTTSVEIDAARLEQALLNLAMNARDAMPNGGTFRVQLRERVIEDGVPACSTARGRFVMVRCTDTGSGIGPAHVDRIFEPFYTTKASRGTGLGLTMVRKTIEDAGGFIEVTSEPHQGTTFTLNLPAVSNPD